MREDEVTFAGEAIRAYKKSSITFETTGSDFITYNPDGSSVSLIDTLDVAKAHYAELARMHPEFMWQLARTNLEQSHVRHALDMQPGDIRLVTSDCPEEELNRHGKNVFGYQGGDVKLGFFQLFYMNYSGELVIYGHSFEQNDQTALDAVYGLFGQQRDRSIWALAQPIDARIGNDIDPEELLGRVVATYDNSLHETLGGEWFAGRRNVAASEEEANAFVRRQADLLNVHLALLEKVGPKSAEANDLRYDFAIAIRRRYEGKTTEGSYDSAASELAHEGAAAREAGESVDACGVSLNGQKTAEEKLADMGMQALLEQLNHNKKKWMGCPQCGLDKACYDDPCANELKCRWCRAHVRNGNYISRGEGREAAYARRYGKQISAFVDADEQEKITRLQERVSDIKHQFGQYAVNVSRVVLGGRQERVEDRRTGEILAIFD